MKVCGKTSKRAGSKWRVKRHRIDMDFIKDAQCTRDTPVRLGAASTPIYGKGGVIEPQYPGRLLTEYDHKMHLPRLLPLEDYDQIIVLFSSGKDSVATYIKLLELGVPKSKIVLFHHDIDGHNPTRRMDWPVTSNYVRAFAEAEGVSLRVSWRVNGFFGELYRVGASLPIQYEANGTVRTCKLSDAQLESEQLRAIGNEAQLKELGYRMKFPAKSADLSRRWCSAYLKISVADAVIRNLNCITKDSDNVKLLIVSGERRGESVGRSKYNEIEIHRTNAVKRSNRLVHQWRPVIDHSLRDVWEMCGRHGITPHPCYSAGWNRCSCAGCIFSLPCHWAGIRELFPVEYEALRQDEIRLGFTLDNNKPLDEFVGDAESCVYHGNQTALRQLVSGGFTRSDIYSPEWDFPAGAFRGSEGGPC
jgi:3'-phosphoadenosine 5'-phosphosulfate sulfotransferase (PAPS reductase)/FAD synthetase